MPTCGKPSSKPATNIERPSIMSTKIPSPIETAVDEFIKAANVSFSVAIVGATKRDDWECDEWRVTVTAARIEFATEYFTGTGHRETVRSSIASGLANGKFVKGRWEGFRPVAPSAASVFYSLLRDGEAINESFSDWCDNYGYDTDSRKALSTYEACCESGRKLCKVFNHEQRQQLVDLLQDY